MNDTTQPDTVLPSTALPDTTVTLTGTGVPHPVPGRAGAGTLVRYGDVSLQFDAGRSTVMRMVEAGVPPYDVTAVFLTHVHSDHLVGLPDLAMTRWVQQQLHTTGPLTIVTAEGGAADFAREMFGLFAEDLATRMAHVQPDPPEIDLHTFDASFEPAEVWRSADGAVVVESVAVHHEPVEAAVAYKVTTPTGVVVISGDTMVCDEVESISAGCDVLVHEACRTTALAELIKGTVAETIFSYHADTVPLGGLAERAEVGHLLLTHLIPPPNSDADLDGFAADVRQGGFTGELTVGNDLTTVTVNNQRPG